MPAGSGVQLRWEAELGKAFVPDGEEVIEGDIADFSGCLDVDNAIAGMRVHPVEAAAVGSDAYTFRNRHVFAVDVDAEMGVNMVGALLHTVTTNAIDGWIEGIEVDYSLYLQERKTNEA